MSQTGEHTCNPTLSTIASSCDAEDCLKSSMMAHPGSSSDMQSKDLLRLSQDLL